MANDKWITCETAVTSFGSDRFAWVRLERAIRAGLIRARGQNADHPHSEPVDIPAEHLAEGRLQPPDRLILPGGENIAAPIACVKVRLSQSDVEKIREKQLAAHASQSRQLGGVYFDEPRWPLHRALAWIAFRTPEALTLTLNELVLDTWAALRGFGDAAGLVSKNPVNELLAALKAGKLKAIDGNHIELPAEFWDEASSNPKTWPTVRFQQEVMRRFWPSGPDLRAILEKGIKDKGAMLTQTEAWRIAQKAGAIATRDKVIEMLKSLGGSDKRGPKGPRKNCAARSA